jgi:3-oxoadipate enol-lactonase
MDGILESESGKIHYAVEGEGLAVVFVNGFTLDTRMWDDQVPAFSRRFKVVRYDMRGSGKSAPPSGPYAQHEDIRALMDALHLETAHVVGLSSGAAVAIDFTLTHPERVRSLVVADTSALGGYEWPEALSKIFAPIYEAAKQGDLAKAKAHWLGSAWFAPALRNPDAAPKLKKIVDDYSGWHFQHKGIAIPLERPAAGRLGEIKVPTLVIVGELDLPFYNHPIADALAAGIPGARKVVIPGVGHMVNMEDPATFNRVTLEFLDEVETVSGP